jgi:hypothetical protein
MLINPNPPLGAVVGSLAALALSPLYRYRTNILKINKYFFALNPFCVGVYRVSPPLDSW